MKNLKNLVLSDLKLMSNEELTILADEIRKEILKTVSKNGGHLSANLGVVELTIMLHKVFNSPKDMFLFDVSHQIYTHKLLTGRVDEFESLGKLGGITGFSKRTESIHDVYEMGHSSTSISAAIGFMEAKKTNADLFNDIITVIGDGSLTNGVALEALTYLSSLNDKIIIIINDNSMCISQNIDGLNKSYKEFFTTLGFEYIGNIDGHSFDELEKNLNIAKKINKKIVLHVKTIKGKGYQLASDDKIGVWHRVPPFDIETGQFLTKDSEINSLFGEKMIDHIIKNHLNNALRVITPGMAQGCGIDKIAKEHPNLFIDVGIAEENAVIIAAALAQSNVLPIVFSYSTFFERAFGEILHDVTRVNQHVIFCVDRAGIVSGDGDTHQGIFDIGFFSLLPNMKILAPCCTNEATQMLDFAIKNDGPVVIRYPKISNEIEFETHFEYGKWEILKSFNKNDPVIITYGPTVLEIYQKIKSMDNIGLINASTIKDFDSELVDELIKNNNEIYLLEEVLKEGSLYSLLCNKYIGTNIKIHVMCLNNTYLEVGSVAELKEKYQLTIEDLLKEIERNDHLC